MINNGYFADYWNVSTTNKYKIGRLLDATLGSPTYPRYQNFIAFIAFQLADYEETAGNYIFGEDSQFVWQAYMLRSGHKWAAYHLCQIYDYQRQQAEESGFPELDLAYIDSGYYSKVVAGIVSRFRDKWTKLYATYQIQYDVLNNYEISIVGSRADSGTQTNSSSGTRNNQGSSSYSKTVYSTDTLSHGHNIVGTATGNNNTFGFNTSSADGVPYAKSVSRTITNNSGSDTKQINGTDTSTDSNSSQITDSLSGQGTLSNSRNYSETRIGRFGNFAPQDLIRKQMELWKESFFNEVFNDIDTVLALKVY